MGVAISHKLGNRKVDLKNTLDRTEKMAEEIKVLAEKIGVEVRTRRDSDYSLAIDISGCETLDFHFKSVKEIKEAHKGVDGQGFDYVWCAFSEKGIELDEGYLIEEYPQNELYYEASFCKTQFQHSGVCHKWVCDLIKSVASNSRVAIVMDEADFYHSQRFSDIDAAIEEVAGIMQGTVEQLTKLGYKQN